MIDSIYWVITHSCNDTCAHCYNASQPGGDSLTLDDARRVVAHLPDDPPARVILSGGEPLTRRALLFGTLDALWERYGSRTQLMLQTNGDLLDGAVLDDILAHHVTRIDIASIDRFHRLQGARRAALTELFCGRDMAEDDGGALVGADRLLTPHLSFGFWGADENSWIGGNWPRGRAMETGVWLKDPSHNFCALVSGARGFLGGLDGVPQEVAIQLAELYPCCPSTVVPLADLREESLEAALTRAASQPVWQALHRGDPWAMGEAQGIDRAAAETRVQALGSVCLWCDEFFTHHYDGLRPARTSRFVMPAPPPPPTDPGSVKP